MYNIQVLKEETIGNKYDIFTNNIYQLKKMQN